MSMASSADRPRRVRRVLTTATSIVAAGLVSLSAIIGTSTLAGAGQPNMTSSGSSFASVAIQEWVGQSSSLFGTNINWQVSSSVFGLNDFAQNSIDFAASDIPFSAGQAQYSPNQPYQYMPDVAGGLAFMYNLNGTDGQRINSLNLSAPVIDGIFLGQISYWDDSRIASLNPSLQGDLPHLKIIPVFRTDPSGENYLLSDYMLHVDGNNFQSAQSAFQSGAPGSPSANWPRNANNSYGSFYPNAANEVGQSGSDNASNYVAAAASLGAITYVETAYAKQAGFPVANLQNASGAFVQPTSVNVATALEDAILHPDLTQDLTNVYTNKLSNAYPLSAYSYFATPCQPALASAQPHPVACTGSSAPSPFPASKGQSLGQFVAFVACLGQANMASLGYSPLPPNLVQEDFDAVGRMTGGVQPPAPTPANCQNPYVDGKVPLPGEPAVAGVTSTYVPPAGSAAAKALAAQAAGKTAGASGSGTSAGGSGTTGGSNASTAGLTQAEIAAGVTVVNGKKVKTLNSAGVPSKYERADQLVAAAGTISSPSLLLGVGIPLLVIALVFGPALVMMQRRKGAADGLGS